MSRNKREGHYVGYGVDVARPFITGHRTVVVLARSATPKHHRVHMLGSGAFKPALPRIRFRENGKVSVWEAA